jgi:hypothetical protein
MKHSETYDWLTPREHEWLKTPTYAKLQEAENARYEPPSVIEGVKRSFWLISMGAVWAGSGILFMVLSPALIAMMWWMDAKKWMKHRNR